MRTKLLASADKLKFRSSVKSDKEVALYDQLIHERRVKQINTHYKIKSNEWDESNDIRTSETYLTTLNSFNRFWMDVDIMLEEINS